MTTTACFPNILLRLIESEQFPNAIGWGPNGTVRINPSAFERDVLKLCFQGVTKFASFTRKMNRYGFKRVVTKGDLLSNETFIYQHQVFRQGVSLDQASEIRIQKQKKALNKVKQLSLASLKSADHKYCAGPPTLRVATTNALSLNRMHIQNTTPVSLDKRLLRRQVLIRPSNGGHCSTASFHTAFHPRITDGQPMMSAGLPNLPCRGLVPCLQSVQQEAMRIRELQLRVKGLAPPVPAYYPRGEIFFRNPPMQMHSPRLLPHHGSGSPLSLPEKVFYILDAIRIVKEQQDQRY